MAYEDFQPLLNICSADTSDGRTDAGHRPESVAGIYFIQKETRYTASAHLRAFLRR